MDSDYMKECATNGDRQLESSDKQGQSQGLSKQSHQNQKVIDDQPSQNTQLPHSNATTNQPLLNTDLYTNQPRSKHQNIKISSSNVNRPLQIQHKPANQPSRQAVTLKKSIDNKKSQRKDNKDFIAATTLQSQKKHIQQHSKKTQSQPKQKSNRRLKQQIQNQNQAQIQQESPQIGQQVNSDQVLDDKFLVNADTDQPEAIKLDFQTENGQGFFDPIDFQVHKFEQAQIRHSQISQSNYLKGSSDQNYLISNQNYQESNIKDSIQKQQHIYLENQKETIGQSREIDEFKFDQGVIDCYYPNPNQSNDQQREQAVTISKETRSIAVSKGESNPVSNFGSQTSIKIKNGGFDAAQLNKDSSQGSLQQIQREHSGL